MSKLFKKIALLLTIIAVGVICMIPTTTVKAENIKQNNLGSLADSYNLTGGEDFELLEDSRIFVVSETEPSGDLLQTSQLIQKQFADEFSDHSFEMVWGPKDYAWDGDIVLYLNKDSGIATEGYELNVAKIATVSASDVDGLLYGANMLQKYFRVTKSETLKGFTAADVPDTKERTVSLDCGRKYFTAEWIKNFIKQMSWMGYNTIELHFSDDGGYRFDIWNSSYYKGSFNPKNDFSWICGGHPQYWVHGDYVNYVDQKKYLTTSEIIDILDTAKEYHLDVIPSFDSPSHLDYLTWKFEQNYKSNNNYSFEYNGQTFKASSNNGCINYTNTTGGTAPDGSYSTINVLENSMGRAFVFAIYEDLANFFKEYSGSKDFSIGADEVPNNSKRVWDYEDFVDYINDLNTLLNNKGYTMRMFNDYIGSKDYSLTDDGVAKYDYAENIEIMYWDSDFNPTSGKSDGSPINAKYFWSDQWGDGGRTLYNCIQTNCYYVLRVATSGTNYPGMDARNPLNYNWAFYHSNEEDIYKEWYPANIAEKGKYTDDVEDVPDEYLGGAYFLVWNDYASVSTETQIWEGAPDVQNSSTKYYLIDRMWSNIIKMWNSDINDTDNGGIDYVTFASVRDTFGYLPGYTSCSTTTDLKESVMPTRAYRVDHSALNAAILEGKLDQGTYTDESYAEYETAYNTAIGNAETVNANFGATEEDVSNAILALTEAKSKLVEIDKTDLTSLVKEVDELSSTDYTSTSWVVLEEALEVANAALAENVLSQAVVDNAYNELLTAKNALVVAPEFIPEDHEGNIIVIDKLSNTFVKGKQIGFRVITSTSVESLSIHGVSKLSLCTEGKVQTLKDLGEVKVWLVYFDANKTGNIYYSILINGTNAGQQILVTVK